MILYTYLFLEQCVIRNMPDLENTYYAQMYNKLQMKLIIDKLSINILLDSEKSNERIRFSIMCFF